jgi:hypothetical protein
MGTEDEPYEGEVPLPAVAKAVEKLIRNLEASSQRVKFVFDGFTHKTPKDFIEFTKPFGAPNFIINLTASEQAIKERYCKEKEVDEIPEEG